MPQLLQVASTQSEFFGYVQHDFMFRGRAGKLVEPHQAAPGRPWVWRARFWGHEPQVDTALLHKGFHVAYYDVVDLYGSPTAVRLWNQFYKLMRRGQLARKVALEALSRGGLYAYNWAAKNPHRVACVYADAPVLDIRSWPGGLGIGPGSPADWVNCRAAWRLTTDEAVRGFHRNPLDQVARIVRGNYPLLHVCGAADEVVPVSENTDLFESRVKQQGGRIIVLRKPGGLHHPHSLQNPAPIVDFIVSACGLH